MSQTPIEKSVNVIVLGCLAVAAIIALILWLIALRLANEMPLAIFAALFCVAVNITAHCLLLG